MDYLDEVIAACKLRSWTEHTKPMKLMNDTKKVLLATALIFVAHAAEAKDNCIVVDIESNSPSVITSGYVKPNTFKEIPGEARRGAQFVLKLDTPLIVSDSIKDNCEHDELHTLREIGVFEGKKWNNKHVADTSYCPDFLEIHPSSYGLYWHVNSGEEDDGPKHTICQITKVKTWFHHNMGVKVSRINANCRGYGT
jgi:hypothetical protein